MIQIKKGTFDFLSGLRKNNNKEWFDGNRKIYMEVKYNFESFVQAAINSITDFEPILKGLEASSCIFRINRDIRFSSDKSPYKSHLGAYIVRGGRKNGDRFAGYYIHIEPGHSLIAGGAHLPSSAWLSSIRERIDEQPEKLRSIVNDPVFIKYFGKIEGEKLKSAPKGFAKDNPNIELLKYKSYFVVNEVPDKEVIDPGYLQQLIKTIKVMKPLNDFLNNYQ
jgi:uncharacterized protein (TIGR02453 family)